MKKFNKPKLEMTLEARIDGLEQQFKNLQSFVFDRLEQKPNLLDVS